MLNPTRTIYIKILKKMGGKIKIKKQKNYQEKMLVKYTLNTVN